MCVNEVICDNMISHEWEDDLVTIGTMQVKFVKHFSTKVCLLTNMCKAKTIFK